MEVEFHTQLSIRRMDRRQLQKLAKKHGIKANLPSEDIIRKILEAQQNPPQPKNTTDTLIMKKRQRAMDDNGSGKLIKRLRSNLESPLQIPVPLNDAIIEPPVARTEVTKKIEPQKPRQEKAVVTFAKTSELTELAKKVKAIQGLLHEKRKTIRSMNALIKKARQTAITYRMEVRAEAGRFGRLHSFLRTFNSASESEDEDNYLVQEE